MLNACLLMVALQVSYAPAPPPYRPTEAEMQQLGERTEKLAAAIARLRASRADAKLLADVEVYHKAAIWIARYADSEFYSKRYLPDALAGLDRGLARAAELDAGKPSWPAQKGQLVRAYRSRVDGSVQPYGLTISANYDGAKPARLDVVLHGRGATLNEVSFIAGHDSAKPAPADFEGIRLEVFGRGNNAYRWAGETDVFEAITSVCGRYKIDPTRIVLRGFSMGGAGAWHLGLHFPSRWAAVEAGAGFTDTKRYAKIESLPPYQDATLHIYDAVDYAPNVWNVPFVGYAGEEDGQLQAAANIRQRLVDEGFHFTPKGLNWIGRDISAVFLVGPKTGHKFHPESKQQSDAFINESLGKPRRSDNRIRFVTYTTRYNECGWLRIDALDEHYVRSEVDARRSGNGARIDVRTKNIAGLTLSEVAAGVRLAIDGTTVALPGTPAKGVCTLAKTGGRWTLADESSASGLRKRRGLQGPIDDAFMDRFICVRPTGSPWHQGPHALALARLATFEKEFAKWMRGDVRVLDDQSVGAGIMADNNLIVFGDPGSNAVLAKIADKLPIRWSRDGIALAGEQYSSADHLLVMIYPNPLNPNRYVVINSGHTFGEKEFRGTNALLFPRLGDYAVLSAKAEAGAEIGAVRTAGLFGERWELRSPNKP